MIVVIISDMMGVQNLVNSRRDTMMFRVKKTIKTVAVAGMSCLVFGFGGNAIAVYNKLAHEQCATQNIDSQGFIISAQGELIGYNGDAKEVVVPESVKKIAFGVFLDRDNIEKILLPDNLEIIDEYAFFGCNSLKGITIPDKVKKIGRLAFGDCKSCKKIDLGSEIKEIKEFVFEGCDDLEQINVKSSNKHFSSKDGILYDKNQSTVIVCPANKKGIVNLPQTTEIVSGYAFANCKNIQKVCKAGDKPLKLEDASFYRCENLAELDIDGGFSKIGSCAFAGCKSLKEFIIGNQVSKVGSLAFMKCESLRKVTFVSNKTTLGKNVFASCPQTIMIIADENSDIAKYVSKHLDKFILA